VNFITAREEAMAATTTAARCLAETTEMLGSEFQLLILRYFKYWEMFMGSVI